MHGHGESPDESHTSAGVDDGTTEPTRGTGVDDGSTSAARLLEVAATTADRLVVEARTEAESLVTAARGEADAILGAARTQADRVATELARSKREQTVALERERATALAGLAGEKSALEERIATLHKVQRDHRSQLRAHLERQLALLDAAVPDRPLPSLPESVETPTP
jgi:cell division septum initiation protein DivIVA